MNKHIMTVICTDQTDKWAAGDHHGGTVMR